MFQFLFRTSVRGSLQSTHWPDHQTLICSLPVYIFTFLPLSLPPFLSFSLLTLTPGVRIFFSIDSQKEQKGGKGKREGRERQRETSIGCLPHALRPGWGLDLHPSSTQADALTTEHDRQGTFLSLYSSNSYIIIINNEQVPKVSC